MARSTSQAIQTPGAASTPDTAETAPDAAAPASDQSARIAELEAQIAALSAQPPAQPTGVYEPQTPHGVAALKASSTGSMTIAEVMQAIDDKRLPEPITSYLCADGHYARRG